MRELQRKQKVRRAIYSIPSLIILAFIAFILAKGAWGVMGKERESRASSENFAERAAAIAAREAAIKEGLSRLKTEEGIKSEIRERFSVTQEGEYVAVIVDDNRVSSSTDGSVMPWYKRFWTAIMRKR